MNNNAKPLAYLDQNVLDFMLKNGRQGLFDYFIENFQVVYSDYTLREIYKAGYNANDESKAFDFIQILEILKAQHIQLCKLEDGHFNIWRSFKSPNEHYQHFIEFDLPFDKYLQPTILTNQAFYNGIADYQAFGFEQKSNMVDLANFMQNQLAEFEELRRAMSTEELEGKSIQIDNFIEFHKQNLAYLNQEIPTFNANVDFTNQMFKSMNAENDANKEYQKHYNIDINNLKKINEYNVLPRIFEYIQRQNPDKNLDINTFFNLQPNQQVFQKVLILYSHLNLLGYEPDKKLKNKDKFMRSYIDMNHASLACFCEFLFTNDEPFIVKTKVAYEYLNVMTKIYSVEIIENGEKISLIPKYDLLQGLEL